MAETPTTSLPAAHALHLLEVGELLGVPRARLLEAWKLDEATLSEPDRRLDLRTLRRLVATTRKLSGERGLGLMLGARMQIANHGNLGFAVLTAPTVRDGLETAIRYVPTRTEALSIQFHTEGEYASITIDEHADFGDARDVVLIALVVGIWRIGVAVTGTDLAGDVHFAFPAPNYAERFASLAPGAVYFDQPRTRLVFDRDVLDRPLVMADAAAHRRACEHCELELARRGRRFAPRVRAALEASPPPDLEAVARSIGVSARTLKRRLRDESTRFAELRDEVLADRAMLLLASDAGLDAIAEALGYHDAAGFSRAFRRWTGRTPGSFRR